MSLATELYVALRCHWRHYLAEAAGLAFFITWGSLLTVAFEHPASPLHQALPGSQFEMVRLGLVGLGMGLVIVAVVYSPWGKQSGAHINPAVTLAFWQMGKIRLADALWYVLAQGLGGIASAWLWAKVLGGYYAHPSVHYVTTKPGPAGPGVAFVAEFIISFILMGVLLTALHHKRLKKVTGWLVGALLAIYILFETPYSGMSLNPARSLASAVVADDFESLWVYFVAPTTAMWLATMLFLRFRLGQPLACAIVAGCEATPNSPHAEAPPHYPAKAE
ncbi:MIP/aquaporin family protein [Hymenobacter arizonensis]|uniref:Aquaporin Z n=1 Tax=Hymenobacter arizonensis TaxID=1227077 RepID=A0A1I6B5H1_HYMAR|nr:aquaporin [Hymenobacter arizonensis]SFQ76163.1 aquaporin Z [Hymenobacter arizonensis]